MASARLTAFTHKNRRIVAGLFWQPLERPRAYMKEAREIGREHQMDIVTIRRTETVIQAGFISKKLGAVKGMYSLASILAEKLGTKENNYSFLAAVRLDDGRYAMVAVSGNAILPESDRIEDVDSIRRHLDKFYSLLDNPEIQVYAPPELDYGHSHVELAGLLETLGRQHQLTPLFFGLSPREMALGAAAVAVILAAVIGFQQWRSRAVEKERQAAVAAAAERARLQRESGTKATAQALVHPWAGAPKPAEFVRICQPAIEALPLALAAWVFESATCTTSGLQAIYKRPAESHTTIDDFVSHAGRKWPGLAVVYGEDDTARIRQPLKFLAGGDDALLPLAKIRNALISHFQRQLVLPHVKQQASVAKPLPGQGDKAPPPDWTTLTFAPESHIAPEQLLAELPATGVRIHEIAVALQDITLNWTIKGEIYAK